MNVFAVGFSAFLATTLIVGPSSAVAFAANTLPPDSDEAPPAPAGGEIEPRHLPLIRQVTSEDEYVKAGEGYFSPDGAWIVFRSDRKKEAYLQIHVIRVDGKHDDALTDTVGVNWAPYWHPTEPYIIWTGADHSKPGRPNYDLWLMPYEIDGETFRGGEVRRITDHPAADVLPVFSPDGKRLMWTSTRSANGTSQLFISDFRLPKVAQ